MKRYIFIFLIYGFSVSVVHPQFYSTGESPSQITWKQIKTPHFSLVFPENMTQQACRMADIMEHYFPRTQGSYNPRITRIPVLLQQHSVISNGYVTLAPWRMEIVTTTPQETYSQDWLTQLALHETRHVIQLQSLNRGFIHAMGFLTGQLARGVSAAQVPAWFYEGDAVDNETELSYSGRGRQASFEMPLRTILDSRSRMYSYDKSLFGSYRDFVPDHYHFGYEIVKYGRTRLNDSIWPDVLKYTARHPYLIWPFAIRLKNRYGVFNSGLYRQTMKALSDEYHKQAEPDSYTDYVPLNMRVTSLYTSYLYPHLMNEIDVVTYRKGLNDAGTFTVTGNNGSDKTLLATGYRQSDRFDVRNGKLIWDEIRFDPRWKQRNYSVIRTLDLETGKSKAITRRSRYFSPSFSPDMSKIAVSENDIRGNNYLTILDAASGKVLKRISVENKEIKTPVWADDREVVLLTVTDQGKSLLSINLLNESQTKLVAETISDLADPCPFGNFVLFSADANGRNDIFAVNKNTGRLYRITKSRYGALQPSASGGTLTFADYTFKGYNICLLKADTSSWEKISGFIKRPDVSNDTIHQGTYDIKRYSKAGHLVNVHSWLPFYVNLDEARNNASDTKISPGIMLFNQNILSTLISTISYEYFKGYHYFRPEIEFRGWYPVIRFSSIIGGPQQSLGVQTGDLPDNPGVFNSFNIESYLPLYFNTGRYNCYIEPSVELEHSAGFYSSNNQVKRGINLLHMRLSSGILRRMSVRNIYPSLGQTISLAYSRGVTNQPFGNVLSVEGITYLPGLLHSHNLILKYGAERQHPGNYFIPLVRVDFPRGFNEYVSRVFASLKVNYSFPVTYPDLAIGPLLYIKRIRANLFYDAAYGKDVRSLNPGFTGFYNSLGSDVLFDFHAFRILFPVSAGIRIGYKPGQHDFFTELIFSINTNSF